jgi:hypothetical protein
MSAQRDTSKIVQSLSGSEQLDVIIVITSP